MEIEEDVKTLRDYIQIARRRKFLIIVPALVLMLIGAVVVILLPPLYESEATILIEQQQIPTDLIKSTVTSYADERIRLIEQRIMTVANVSKIIEKYHLYPRERAKLSISELVDIFRENTRVEMINADVVSMGRGSKATIAFKLVFTDKNPATAQQVANELVTLFLSENVRSRTMRAEETTKFLEEEADKFKIEIQKIENAIAEYKQKYSESLPELLPINLATLNRLENEIQQLNLQERMLNERRVNLNAQLAITSPVLVSNPVNAESAAPVHSSLEELQILERSLLSKYSPSHPDVVRVRRQIESQMQETENDDANKLDESLKQARQVLSELSQKYSESHPDVRVLKKKIADLERDINKKNQESNLVTKRSSGSLQHKITNPAYLQLKSEMDISEIELQNVRNYRAALQQKIQVLEKNISQTHQVERGYYELMRDLESHKAKYQDLKSKQLQAKLAQTLEEEQKGESFTLIEPPMEPVKPIKPNRLKLLLLVVVLSIAAGLGSGLLAEMLDTSIRGHYALAKLTGMEPLIVIPYIRNQADKEQTRKHIIFFSVSIVVLLVLLVMAIHFLYKPLDILWYKLMQRIGLI